ncbi:MAG: hypothetical protein D6698_06375 [Gammaproteobacteria bacterium]|nr:MAG: hypothetical protein D6698_06375 [Gammaproteobacteria bacterium]
MLFGRKIIPADLARELDLLETYAQTGIILNDFDPKDYNDIPARISEIRNSAIAIEDASLAQLYDYLDYLYEKQARLLQVPMSNSPNFLLFINEGITTVQEEINRRLNEEVTKEKKRKPKKSNETMSTFGDWTFLDDSMNPVVKPDEGQDE